MHKITFFPIGNADCCRIDLQNGKKLLFDYANMKDNSDCNDLRLDLEKELKDDLKTCKRDYFDIVSFSHADDDHVHGLSKFFYLDHASQYQGKNRIKIRELWVPAAILMEKNPPEDVRILRQEARYRLKQKKGIKIFSEPELLKSWIEQDKNLKYEECKKFIVEAGNTIDSLQKDNDGVEVFVHAPFKKQLEKDVHFNRNDCSSIFHMTFYEDNKETKLMLIGDTDYEVISEIVDITKYYSNEEKLEWDIFDIPHHCSYKALNSEKGEKKTDINEKVRELLDKGNEHGILISCSKIIPTDDSDKQPPHRQAMEAYKEMATAIKGEVKVTMEYPNKKNPQPLVITIDKQKARIAKNTTYTTNIITSTKAPRAGR